MIQFDHLKIRDDVAVCLIGLLWRQMNDKMFMEPTISSVNPQ